MFQDGKPFPLAPKFSPMPVQFELKYRLYENPHIPEEIFASIINPPELMLDGGLQERNHFPPKAVGNINYMPNACS